MRFARAAIALAMLAPSFARAGEIYSLVLKDCDARTGAIVDVADGWAQLLAVDGTSARVAVDSVDSVYIYSFVENPIRAIRLDRDLEASLRAVYLDDGDQPSFYGWPVRFVESLSMFYDVTGKSHVYENESIVKIRPATGAKAPPHAETWADLPLDRSRISARCPSREASAGGSRPIRVISDEIKVRQFFEDFERGYDTLKGYEERTYIYARPMLFDPKTRFGLSFVNQGIERAMEIPFYVQWSSGRPYRFQSYNVFGRAENEFLPNAEPFFGFRNDLKAHAFHSHFSGNLSALSAGTSYYVGGPAQLDDAASRHAVSGEAEYLVTVNYLALMGLDYGPFSVSGGFYYPTHAIRVGDDVREILANRVSYAARLMATFRKTRWRVVASQANFDSGKPTNDDVKSAGVSILPPDSYSFASTFVRGGVDWKPLSQLSLSGDLIVENGDYAEKSGSNSNLFKARTRSAVVSLRQEFGDYVSVVATGIWTWRDLNWSWAAKDGAQNDGVFRYGGAFEFVF